MLCIIAAGDACAQPKKTIQNSQETKFFTNLPDIPLMEGVTETPEKTIYFDKPEGRIIVSYAQIGMRSPAQIGSYYKQILPEFGWKVRSDGVYQRGREFLELSFEKQKNHQFLKITLKPQA